ncbi:hypothetical protein BT69DRAFT_444626 [Atractiella rhizophila]|nr:hypothetical protein BT69DRAFT_444626 [Atractiella rhizophila]
MAAYLHYQECKTSSFPNLMSREPWSSSVFCTCAGASSVFLLANAGSALTSASGMGNHDIRLSKTTSSASC